MISDAQLDELRSARDAAQDMSGDHAAVRLSAADAHFRALLDHLEAAATPQE